MSDAGSIVGRLSLAGLAGDYAIHAVRGRERVSAPFTFAVDFSAYDVALDEARGQMASLWLNWPDIGHHDCRAAIGRTHQDESLD